jgi:hypothetical protein
MKDPQVRHQTSKEATRPCREALRIRLFILSVLLLVPSMLPGAYDIATVQSEEVAVLFEGPLGNAAKEVIEVYPAVRSELEGTFRWEVGFRPSVLLMGDSGAFKREAGSDITIALAIPARCLIVIDNSRVHARPFTLKTTLKHELCHLLLHHNIDGLPRWLDEGVCQWASDGMAELIMSSDEPDLTRASLSGSLLPLREMERFPADEGSLRLAYAESRSMVEYITGKYGRDGLLSVLENLRGGLTLEEALGKSLSVSMRELEGQWHDYLEGRYTWLTYISNNIYYILLSLAALMTVYGFIRFLMRKRAYRDEDEGPY